MKQYTNFNSLQIERKVGVSDIDAEIANIPYIDGVEPVESAVTFIHVSSDLKFKGVLIQVK